MAETRVSTEHFFNTGRQGDEGRGYSRENPDPEPADPVVAKAPQVAGAPANPIAIAEPTDPPQTHPVKVTRDEFDNIEQANLSSDLTEEVKEVDPVPVAGGAQVGFTKDPRPEDVRRSAQISHQPVGDLKEQAAEKRSNQRQAAKRSAAKKSSKK